VPEEVIAYNAPRDGDMMDVFADLTRRFN